MGKSELILCESAYYEGEESECLFKGRVGPETPHLNPLPQGERKDRRAGNGKA